MGQIILKPAPKTLAITKNPRPLPTLLILLKPPLIPHPLVLNQMQCPIIYLPIYHLRLLIIQYSIPMQPIILPFPLIRQLTISVVQSPSPMHLVSHPMPCVPAAFDVVKNAVTVTHIVELVALVCAPGQVLTDVVGGGMGSKRGSL